MMWMFAVPQQTYCGGEKYNDTLEETALGSNSMADFHNHWGPTVRANLLFVQSANNER
jgi:hypothetical protein